VLFWVNCEQHEFFISFEQRSMNLYMQNGYQKDVLFVDGLKIGMITKL
jgi:hypothetical protein